MKNLVVGVVALIVLVASVAFMSGGPAIAEAASQGAFYPSSGTNNASVGTTAWTNPGNITVDDGSYAITSVASGGTTSNYLFGNTYGFAIPLTATIDGIIVEIDKRTEAGSRPGDQNMRIIKADGSLGSANKAQVGVSWTAPGGYTSYGGAADLWSESWTPSDINDADFGAAINTAVDATGGPHDMRVDTIRITVYYTDAAGPTSITSDAVLFE